MAFGGTLQDLVALTAVGTVSIFVNRIPGSQKIRPTRNLAS